MSTTGLDKAYLRFGKAKAALARAVKREIVKVARKYGIRHVVVYEQRAACERRRDEWVRCEEIADLWDRYLTEVGEEMIYKGEWRSRRGWVDFR